MTDWGTLSRKVSYYGTSQAINTTSATAGGGTWATPKTGVNPGSVMTIVADGEITTHSSGTGTLTVELLYGSTAVASVTTGTLTTSLSAEPVTITARLNVISVGSSGTCKAHIDIACDDATVADGAHQSTATTTDLTAGSAIGLRYTLSGGSANTYLTVSYQHIYFE